MSKLYEKMHNLFAVSKTLRFELKPVGETKKYFEENILKDDEIKAELFQKVKKYCDEYHKYFIERSLAEVNKEDFSDFLLNYDKLFQKNNKTEKETKEFEDIKNAIRKKIVKVFTAREEFKGLFSKDIIISYLPKYYQNDKDILKEIKTFEKFTTYFTGYNTNRKNMYSEDKKHTAIAYRLIDENLPTYIKNISAYKQIIKSIPSIKQEIEKSLNISIDDKFYNVENYASILTQSKIEEYNLAISGKSEENNKKIKGINEYVNEYNQKNTEKLPRLKELYKQILSDTNTLSFKFDTIENDNQIIELINDYWKIFYRNILSSNDFCETLNNIQKYSLDKIYISDITEISKKVYGDWNYINSLFEIQYDEEKNKSKSKNIEKYLEKREKEIKKIEYLSILDLENIIKKYDTNNENQGKIYSYLKESSNILIKNIKENYEISKQILNEKYDNNAHILIKDKSITEKIKNLLDSIKQLQSFVYNLVPKDNTLETDLLFYNALKYDTLEEIISIYNKTRNYLTQKPYSIEKIKLNFSCPTLLDGWDLNKETDNLGTLFEKDGLYYLGIINPEDKKIFEKYENNKTSNSNYKKIEYKLLPGANKMLPKVFFSKKNIDFYKPSNELIRKYQLGLHTKGENFDLGFCHELIDFFKTSINKHEDWKKFNFNFSDTSSYEDISQFYKEIEQQGYKLTFKNISEEYMDDLVKEGKLFLFQIYNKDFSKYSKGKENLHTIYWKALFDEDNLKDVIYKLNGKAEIFYRKKSIEWKVTHPKNEEIENKNPLNTKKTSLFSYDLIKDKRYSIDKFQFHVPITMNFKAKNINKLNDFVNNEIKKSTNIHVIGIDRGERHLLYYSVIDEKGNIIEQDTLNTITNEYNGEIYKTNYHDLLDRKEKERDQARKSWGTIENIKALKEGYMSQVVYKLEQLMLKYNAIVVLEDLNSGFKNARKKVEKQVYDKFETKLISKLSYLVNKNTKTKFEEGGTYSAYQLANTDIKSSKQNGVIFYIPAWCTSKIDPLTGFVNLFNLKNVNKEFIEKIDDIRFNEKENYFEFDINYENFSDKSSGKRINWTLCTYGERIQTYKDIKKDNNWNNRVVELTDEFKKLFDKYNIDYKNIKKEILEKADLKFFNANYEKDNFFGFAILFKLLVQLRNSVTNSVEDYILSPIKNKDGIFFDSRCNNNKLPKDADANGAYNIARKGLMLLNRIQDDNEQFSYGIKNSDWLEYVQEFDS